MTPSSRITSAERRRLRANLLDEIGGAHVYRALADVEPNAQVADVYRRLASVEEAHAQMWRDRLAAAGSAPGTLRVGWRSRALAVLARRFGPAFVLPMINTMERVDSGRYDRQADAVAAGLPRDERSHARLLHAIGGGGLPGAVFARMEGRHRGGGNALRAAVLGANDGLVSNLSLVMGVAGAVADGRMLLVTGLAGLVAGALSMAMGEWLSVASARELYQSQMATEADELANSPDEEKEELVLIYQSKGLPETEARALAERLMANHDTAMDALAREELGIDPDALGGSAWAAAGTSMLLFAVGALFPVVPFLFMQGQTAVLAALGLSAAALFGIGVGTSLFTGRSALFSGSRQLCIGLGAAALTYGIGHLAGVGLSG